MSVASPAHVAQRIVIRGVNWLGDAVMTIPAVDRLREALPHAEIVLVTPQKLAALWEQSSSIDSVISLPPSQNVLATANDLRRRRFDSAVLFPNSPRVALEAFLGRVPIRIGYRARWRSAFLTLPVEPGPDFTRMHKRSQEEIQQLISGVAAPCAPLPVRSHQMHHYLRLVSTLGASTEPLPPRVGVAGSEIVNVEEKFALRIGLAEGVPLFGLIPGAEYGPAKRWPWERFATVAAEVHEKTGARWIIFGGSGDIEIATMIKQLFHRSLPTDRGAEALINLAGRTSLRELCAGLKACSVVLSNDTGPMHLAAAVGTKVVGIFGSTSSALTGPGLPGGDGHVYVQSTVACSPCFLPECPIDFRCMRGLEVESVVAAVLKAAGIGSS